uniref:FZ domain-containing protein n=1 Tax=Steinernema glaseri TaxID=37863 RepID=A0A1I7Y9J6_9BILA
MFHPDLRLAMGPTRTDMDSLPCELITEKCMTVFNIECFQFTNPETCRANRVGVHQHGDVTSEGSSPPIPP